MVDTPNLKLWKSSHTIKLKLFKCLIFPQIFNSAYMWHTGQRLQKTIRIGGEGHGGDEHVMRPQSFMFWGIATSHTAAQWPPPPVDP